MVKRMGKALRWVGAVRTFGHFVNSCLITKTRNDLRQTFGEDDKSKDSGDPTSSLYRNRDDLVTV